MWRAKRDVSPSVEIMSIGAPHGNNSKIVVERGTDTFLVCISQLCVNNLKCIFQIGNDCDQLWLWNKAKAVRCFPKEDGSFDLDEEDVCDLRLIVEVPGTGHLGTELHHKSAHVRAKYRSLSPKASPRAEKRLKIGDLECGTSNLRNRFDVTEEIFKQLEELRGALLEMREDVGTLLEMREDVGTLLTIISGKLMEDHQVHAIQPRKFHRLD